MARFRVFNRAWRTARDLRGEAGFLGAALLNDDPVFLNATRFALKNGEHTWGKDVKSNLKDNTDWKNADFAKAKVCNSRETESPFLLLRQILEHTSTPTARFLAVKYFSPSLPLHARM